MGMNYYLRTECGACGAKQSVHLGKSSHGWQFTFRGDREAGVVNYATWLVRLKTLQGAGWGLTDENDGDVYPLQELLDKVEKKRDEPNNQALQYPGPDNWVDESGYSFSDKEFC